MSNFQQEIPEKLQQPQLHLLQVGKDLKQQEWEKQLKSPHLPQRLETHLPYLQVEQ
jgi:hypothetical protein